MALTVALTLFAGTLCSFPQAASGLGTRLLEARELLGPALDGPGFVTIRAVPDAMLGDGPGKKRKKRKEKGTQLFFE